MCLSAYNILIELHVNKLEGGSLAFCEGKYFFRFASDAETDTCHGRKSEMNAHEGWGSVSALKVQTRD